MHTASAASQPHAIRLVAAIALLGACSDADDAVDAIARTKAINWMFTIERARQKLIRSYPIPAGHPVQVAA